MNAQQLYLVAQPSLESIKRLLSAADLPTSDLSAAHLPLFFACGSAEAPTGLVGLEIYGSEGLLRSLVVIEAGRSRGTGSALVAHVEDYARRQNVRSLYLLTTTAEHFFERLGYRKLDRADAPDSIRGTTEFSSICPASSAFMTKPL